MKGALTVRERFRDQVVLITGGAAGLGAQLADDFADEGAIVVVADISAPASPRHRYVTCDITDEQQVAELIRTVGSEYSRIDTLVNNAGVVSRGSAASISTRDWDRIFDINVKGTFLMTRESLPWLTGPTANIVNLASQAGVRAEKYLSHYCAAKAAVVHYTRALALELAPTVRVNAVCPGFVETDMSRLSLEQLATEIGAEYDDVRTARQSIIPLGRFQQPHDISAGVRFLASADAGEITGHILEITGGQTL